MGIICSIIFDESEEEQQKIIEEDDKRNSDLIKIKLIDLQRHYNSTFQPNSVAFTRVHPRYNFSYESSFGGRRDIIRYSHWKYSDHNISFFLDINVGEFKDAKLGFTKGQVVALGLETLQKEMIDKK